MNRAFLIITIALLALGMSACSDSNSLDGRYVASELPYNDDELALVETITIKGNELTMEGKTSLQKLTYKIKGDLIVFETEFGTFTYPFNIDNGNLVIDSIIYLRQSN